MQPIQSLAKQIIPRPCLTPLAMAVLSLRYRRRARACRGGAVTCPCCEGHFRHFLPFGDPPRTGAACPRCGALERHRLIWLYLARETDLGTRPQRLLHCAPEYAWLRRLRDLPALDYVTADLDSALAHDHVDLTALPYPDASFDAMLCVAVLEHITDDRQAMREMFRVLKPGGWAIVHVPLEPDRAHTDEDYAITTPEGRRQHFGQADHVRLYGQDVADRLRAAGFTVEVVDYPPRLGPALVQRHGLIPTHRFFRCEKPP